MNISSNHPYHQVDASPWPIQMGFTGFLVTTGLVCWLNGITDSQIQVGLVAAVQNFFGWTRDIVREGQGGFHTGYVQKGLILGVVLFQVSEVMLFFSFFWAYFHSGLSPSIEQGGEWPPVAIRAIDPWGIPLQGSIILQSSGFTVTLAHHAIRAKDKDSTLIGQFQTVQLGACFVFLQENEYSNGEYTISDSVFGSVFYMTTGLHGLHVIVGVIFLAVGLVRVQVDSFTSEHHQGLEFAIFYWHLVDLVWFFVFSCYYWWGS